MNFEFQVMRPMKVALTLIKLLVRLDKFFYLPIFIYFLFIYFFSKYNNKCPGKMLLLTKSI